MTGPVVAGQEARGKEPAFGRAAQCRPRTEGTRAPPSPQGLSLLGSEPGTKRSRDGSELWLSVRTFLWLVVSEKNLSRGNAEPLKMDFGFLVVVTF